jgi:hypothetical protein
VTSSLSSKKLPSAHGTGKGLAPTPPAVCTRVCTSEAENANASALDAASPGTSPQAAGTTPDADQGNQPEVTAADKPADPLAGLAATLLALSPADRARLAAMLTDNGSTGTIPG